MPEFKNDKLGISFKVPDRPTVRQQLAYFSEAGAAAGREMFARLWLGALTLVADWKCEFMPKPEKVDIDEATDPRVTEAILWAGIRVERHMNSLEELPKVSSPPSSP
jgi:hypothetical protein